MPTGNGADAKVRPDEWKPNTARTIATKLMEMLDADVAQVESKTAEGALARGRVFATGVYIEEAIESYEEALVLDPYLHEAAARLVLLYIRERRTKHAIELAMRLVARAPDYELQEATSDERISAYTLLGNALAADGRLDDAIKAYEVARSTCEHDTTAAARLAQIHIATGRREEAAEQVGAFAANPRFQKWAEVIRLGETSAAFLPTINVRRLSDQLRMPDHGRPFTVDGLARSAPLVHGDASWCADVQDVKPGDQ